MEEASDLSSDRILNDESYRRYPMYLKSDTCPIGLSFIALVMWFLYIDIDFVLKFDMFILNFLAMSFRWYAMICN